MARKMGRNLKRAAASLMACAAIALCAVSPAWGEERASDVVNVTVPTRIDCALGADGTVTAPAGLEVVNNGPQDLYVGASTVDDFGQKVEFAMDLGGSPLLSRTGGKDVEGEVEFTGSSRKGLRLVVSKLNRTSHAALMDAAAQGEAPMFTVGFKFTFKALQGSMAISGEAKLGKTLTATVSGAQADAKLAYRWYRDGQLIAGAEAASYTTNEADQGKKLKCEAYDAAGRYVGTVAAEVGPVKGPEAFAVFSADDGSLNFYKRVDVPKAGDVFEGKAVTEVYTGFEDKEFAISNNTKPNWSDVTTNVPWFNRIQQILSARVIDKNIKPYQLSFWFTQCNNMTQVDLSNLDASRIKRAIGLFGRCHNLHTCMLPTDMNNLNNLSDMFYECRTLNEVDLTCIGTSSVPRNLFALFNGCLSLKTVQIPRQIVRNLGWGFAGCKSITDFSFVENWDVSHAAGTHDLFKAFSGCTSLTSLNLSKWKTSQSLSMEGMFSDCINLRTLDISGFNTSTVTNMAEMFSKCRNLRQVTLGDNFAWKNVDGSLPAPKPNYIPGADGKWYAMSDKKGYAPADIPSNKADTYVASPDMLPKEAFAVFSADDGSLNFYKRSIVPVAGSQFEGKTATNVYTGFEDKEYKCVQVGTQIGMDYEEDAVIDTPWHAIRLSVKTVEVVDEGIKPISLQYWFSNFQNCTSFKLNRLDTTNVRSLSTTFNNCLSVVDMQISSWNVERVMYMIHAFLHCRSLSVLDLSGWHTPRNTSLHSTWNSCLNLTELKLGAGWDTSKVTRASYMFNNCRRLKTLDLNNFDTSNIRQMTGSFNGCSSLSEVKLGNRFNWNDTQTHLPIPSPYYIPNADGYWYDAAIGDAYKSEEIPSNKAATYVAVNPVKAPSVTIEGQPVFGSTLTAKVSGQPAETTATSYQWQFSIDGKNWRDSQYQSAKTESITLIMNGEFSPENNYYRCVVNTTAGKKRVPQGISEAVGPVGPDTREAFAVFSADDGSLNFYKRTEVPKAGSQFEGKTATSVFTGIETMFVYDFTDIPWVGVMQEIRSANVVDSITPMNTVFWFYEAKNLLKADLSRLDASRMDAMDMMFHRCSSLESVDLGTWSASGVNSLFGMFMSCRSLKTVDVSHLDTRNVTTMDQMFGDCSSLVELDISNFDMSNVVSDTNMLYNLRNLKKLTLGARCSISPKSGLSAPSASTIPSADGKWYAASDGRGYAPADIPSNKADTYYASKSLLPAAAEDAPEQVMPGVEAGMDAPASGAGPEVEVDVVGTEAVVSGSVEDEDAERKPDEAIRTGPSGDEKRDGSGHETASAVRTPPEEEGHAAVTSDEAH